MVESKTFKRSYLIGTVIVWVSIMIGTAVILSGTPYFVQMLPILSAGAIWFIVILPGAYFWTRPKSDQPSPKKQAEHTPLARRDASHASQERVEQAKGVGR